MVASAARAWISIADGSAIMAEPATTAEAPFVMAVGETVSFNGTPAFAVNDHVG